eukprot:INCI6243.7.p1 GENE.INCI6243.7~~INCI6243.7.p1  ORF type:complete len:942 (-),score=243.42 INCI6243.7:1777-4602(-)
MDRESGGGPATNGQPADRRDSGEVALEKIQADMRKDSAAADEMLQSANLDSRAKLKQRLRQRVQSLKGSANSTPEKNVGDPTTSGVGTYPASPNSSEQLARPRGPPPPPPSRGDIQQSPRFSASNGGPKSMSVSTAVAEKQASDGNNEEDEDDTLLRATPVAKRKPSSLKKKSPVRTLQVDDNSPLLLGRRPSEKEELQKAVAKFQVENAQATQELTNRGSQSHAKLKARLQARVKDLMNNPDKRAQAAMGAAATPEGAPISTAESGSKPTPTSAATQPKSRRNSPTEAAVAAFLMAGTEHREAAAASGAKVPETKAAAEASDLASQAALPMGNAEVAAADAMAKAADLKMVSPRRVQTRKRLVTAPVVLLTTMYQVRDGDSTHKRCITSAPGDELVALAVDGEWWQAVHRRDIETAANFTDAGWRYKGTPEDARYIPATYARMRQETWHREVEEQVVDGGFADSGTDSGARTPTTPSAANTPVSTPKQKKKKFRARGNSKAGMLDFKEALRAKAEKAEKAALRRAQDEKQKDRKDTEHKSGDSFAASNSSTSDADHVSESAQATPEAQALTAIVDGANAFAPDEAEGVEAPAEKSAEAQAAADKAAAEKAAAEKAAADQAAAEKAALEKAAADKAAAEKAAADKAAAEKAAAEKTAAEKAAAEKAAADKAAAEKAAAEKAAAEKAATDKAAAENAAALKASAEKTAAEHGAADKAERITTELAATELAAAETSMAESASAKPIANPEAVAVNSGGECLTTAACQNGSVQAASSMSQRSAHKVDAQNALVATDSEETRSRCGSQGADSQIKSMPPPSRPKRYRGRSRSRSRSRHQGRSRRVADFHPIGTAATAAVLAAAHRQQAAESDVKSGPALSSIVGRAQQFDISSLVPLPEWLRVEGRVMKIVVRNGTKELQLNTATFIAGCFGLVLLLELFKALRF